MNPVLLKPTSDRSSQVIVMGRPVETQPAADYQRGKAALVDVVDAALADLRSRFDVVICEGAGSPAEINLLDHDIVNLGLAARAGMPAVVVGDIHRGGVFAHLYGTVALLPEDLRRCVRGFIINMFRGDPALLGDAMDQLEARCGVPTLGVLPYLPGLVLDAEDSLHRMLGARPEPPAPVAERLDVVVLRLPRLSNFTDFDPLFVEPGVTVRFVDHPSAFGDPDLVVLPGTKSTVSDLEWLRASGLLAAIEARRAGALAAGGARRVRRLPDAGPRHRGPRARCRVPPCRSVPPGLGRLTGGHHVRRPHETTRLRDGRKAPGGARRRERLRDRSGTAGPSPPGRDGKRWLSLASRVATAGRASESCRPERGRGPDGSRRSKSMW